MCNVVCNGVRVRYVGVVFVCGDCVCENHWRYANHAGRGTVIGTQIDFCSLNQEQAPVVRYLHIGKCATNGRGSLSKLPPFTFVFIKLLGNRQLMISEGKLLSCKFGKS